MILLIFWLSLPVVYSETSDERDVKSFNTMTIIKAGLLPVQDELRALANAPVKEGEKPVTKPELSAAYDKAAIAFNKANDSWKVLEFSKKLGKGDDKARKTFESDLAGAIEQSAKLHLGRGIIP